jgi:chloramphenicol-sensitive protein RarD
VTGARATLRAGLWYGLAAYGIWGLFPLYWKLFGHVPAAQLLAQRVAWSFVALAVITTLLRRSSLMASLRVSSRVAALYALAAVLIGVNWFLYVWAVNAGFVVETSLGYFITPLVNVLLGVVVFRERLRRLQWLAVAVAAAGVVHLTRAYGSLPWIALGLAVSFGSYGLAKKTAPLASLEGLTLETAMLFLPAVGYLAMVHARGEGVFLERDPLTDVLMATSGVITIIPLLLFTSAVRRVPLSVIGILQYIAPSIQLLLGVLVFAEPFTATQLEGFAFVWVALVIFAADGMRARRLPASFAVLDEGAV